MIGRKFAYLTVASFSGINKHGAKMWNCVCDCGALTKVTTGDLNSLHIKSCGCISAKATALRSKTHGMSDSKVYAVWCRIKSRCTNPKHSNYKDYGGRGITICDEWIEFDQFFADMGYKGDGFSIERKDNNKGYSKDNCVWATAKEQANNRRNTFYLELGGEKIPISVFAKNNNISRSKIYQRIRSGMSHSDAVKS